MSNIKIHNKGYIITDMELGDDLNNIILMYEDELTPKGKNDVKDGYFNLVKEDKGNKSG